MSACALRASIGTFDRDNGGGFLTDHFPGASKAIWHFDGAPQERGHLVVCTARRVS